MDAEGRLIYTPSFVNRVVEIVKDVLGGDCDVHAPRLTESIPSFELDVYCGTPELYSAAAAFTFASISADSHNDRFDIELNHDWQSEFIYELESTGDVDAAIDHAQNICDGARSALRRIQSTVCSLVDEYYAVIPPAMPVAHTNIPETLDKTELIAYAKENGLLDIVE